MKVFSSLTITVLLLVSTIARADSSHLAQAEQAWKMRSVGYRQDRPLESTNIDRAILHFRSALHEDPENQTIYQKLIEALYFKGQFVSQTPAEKRRLFTESLELSEKLLGLAKLQSRQNGLATAHFWSAICWGLWGMSHSYFSAARKDVANRIREQAESLIAVDPNYADGGGYRLLGRLHTATPKIPFFTGWIDRAKGIKLLRKANAISKVDPRNELFLAEALLEYEAEKRPEATLLLNAVCQRSPAEDYFLEQKEQIDRACELLEKQNEK